MVDLATGADAGVLLWLQQMSLATDST